jgi:hypothetical protein
MICATLKNKSLHHVPRAPAQPRDFIPDREGPPAARRAAPAAPRSRAAMHARAQAVWAKVRALFPRK